MPPPQTGSLSPTQPGLLSTNPVGIVPVNWRPPPRDPDVFLSELARLGFEGVQLADTFPGGSELRSLLARHEMRLAEVYAALPCTVDGPTDSALQLGRARLRALEEGSGEVLVGAIDGTPDRAQWAGRALPPVAPELTEDGWHRLAELMDRLAAETTAAGFRLAFHPHAGTYVETPSEVERFLAETNPTLVGMCLDTGHDIVGGGDPAATVTRAGSRLTHVHLKDVDEAVLAAMRGGELAGLTAAIDRRLFTPLGSGTLDLAGVLVALELAAYRGWIMIEQDTSWEPPSEAAAISRRVLAWTQRHWAPRLDVSYP